MLASFATLTRRRIAFRDRLVMKPNVASPWSLFAIGSAASPALPLEPASAQGTTRASSRPVRERRQDG
jgi:hypothetical protein